MSVMSRLIDELNLTPQMAKLFEYLDKSAGNSHARLGNLYGSSRTFVAAGIFRHYSSPIILVTRGSRNAEKIEADLLNFLEPGEVKLYPHWEVLPYEDRQEDLGIVGRRIEVLSSLMHETPAVVVVPVRALMQKVMSAERFCELTITLKKDEIVEVEKILQDFIAAGFRREVMVEEVGTISLRGGILDIYGYGMENPVRVEFEDDIIVDIRTFEIATQRSCGVLKDIVILPVSEGMEWNSSPVENSAELSTFFDYLDPGTLFIFDEHETMDKEKEDFVRVVENYYRLALDRRGKTIREPEELFLDEDKLEERLALFSLINMSGLHVRQEGEQGKSFRFETREPPSINRDLEKLRSTLHNDFAHQRRSYIACETSGQLSRFEELLEDAADKVVLCIGSLETGFAYRDLSLVVYTDHEIFRRFRHVRSRGRYKRAPSLESFSSLSDGDYVVHIDYGIGRYKGLKKIVTEGTAVECMWLEYADNEKLYVPVDQLGLVEKYSGEEGAQPTVHKIGGAGWARLKAKTVKAIEDLTEELMSTYAARNVHGGYGFSPDTEWQQELERSFVYDETRDQLKAIEDIKKDMQSNKCMDRLLCGDVGFGKTEVALRAAFKAVQDGKQAAVLVPTTVLAQQHYITFSERLADFPVKVDTLSRFKSQKEQQEIVSSLAGGKVDIIIGTHRILSKDVNFKDLGLLVVDEEQRFGVKHKERLKALKMEVDTLAMTATPIPRTLNMSLLGIRDLSIINTPPQDRLPIVTQICPFDEELIEEAINREIARDGQVFFVHNRIGSIYAMSAMLKRIVPKARITVAHGQMPERQLESAMKAFQNRDVDVLLSTMIIENGLDFPNANTIMINRADCFGLSQLYQLRGRVGRSYHRAYAYLLVPPRRMLTDDAVKRLRVLEEYTELGSGFEIAMRDMEIRGTGNLLGTRQHGHINAVGFDTYMKLLRAAMAELQQDKEKKMFPAAKVTIDIPAYLPEDYVSDQKQKLTLYRKLAELENEAQVDDFAAEISDRFGALPEEAANLLLKTKIRIFATRIGMEAIFISSSFCKLDFGRNIKYRLQPLSAHLESIDGKKNILSMKPPAVMIEPGDKLKALEQITEALRNMAGDFNRVVEDLGSMELSGMAIN